MTKIYNPATDTAAIPLRSSKKWLVLFLVSLLALSCDLLRDSPFQVEGWTPGEGYYADPETIKVSLLFSRESDKTKTELAFSLSEEGKAIMGTFLWEGNSLVFLPASPLESGRDYVINLGTGAQDIKGVSLENKFEASFTTRQYGLKPEILKCEPEYEEIIPEGRGEFRLFFSEPVLAVSCMEQISFSPAASGSWQLKNENRTACFTPKEPWQKGILYRVKVESDFRAASGLILGTEFVTRFYSTRDTEKPVLLKVLAFDSGKEEEIPFEKQEGAFTVPFSSWEKNTKLCLVFSEAIDLSGIKNFLACEPKVPLFIESAPVFSDRAVFRFTEFPEWGSTFSFRLSSGVKDIAGNSSVDDYYFKITTGGIFSKPPSLAGIRIPMTTVSGENYEPLSFSVSEVFAGLPIKGTVGHYPFAEKILSWIELYFECSPETEIDIISLMDTFRVESTNMAMEFTPLNIKTDNFTLPNPTEGWETLQRIEVGGFLVNKINTGIVTFSIAPGLRDKRGNISTENFRISFIK